MTVIKIQNLNKSFVQGKERIDVLKNINLELKQGETISLVGESGSGKSTLLQTISGLMQYDSGLVEILGKDINKLSDSKKTEMRLRDIGFVYQYHHLLSDFTALENVMLPQLALGRSKKDAEAKAKALLERLGLKERMAHKPSELSGGQQQRVAIARALANSPKILFADEPSGNLDNANRDVVMDLFFNILKENGTTLVIATHSREISNKTDRIFTL